MATFTGVEASDILWRRLDVPGHDACRLEETAPSTNLFQLRRLALATGEARDCPAAWLGDAARTLTLLPQRYERRSELTYWYESPTSRYAALLELTPTGFARVYPGLWQREADGQS